ncbi:MAG: hypothetical protein RL286_453 [Bacteroidota bacterium]|jgi:rare lipoprotein A
MHLIYSLLILIFLSSSDDVFQRGKASYYSQSMNGQRTSSGERYFSDSLTAAHARLPFGTRVKVRNLKNDSIVVLRIIDRMSASSTRVIDVSWAAAKKLNFVRDGITQVELSIIDTTAQK